MIAVNQKLLGACRKAGVKVIYLQMTYQADLSDAGGMNSPNYHKKLALNLMRERPDLAGKLLIEGTWDRQIVDKLTPQPGDKVFRKTCYSGFCNTWLGDNLRAENIRNLLFSDVATNICVDSTARDAYFEEFWSIIIEDAINHSGPDFNRQAMLWNFEHVFGWVTQSSDVMAMLETRHASQRYTETFSADKKE